jgi:hypothetical protein
MTEFDVVDDAFDYSAQARYFAGVEAPVPQARTSRVRNFATKIEDESEALLGTTVVAYDEGISEEDREAFDDTILYAEIRADQLFQRETQRREWYVEYSKALTNCGWPTLNDPYKEYISQELNFSMDEAALKIIAVAAGVDKLKILPLISGALDKLEKDDGAIKLMELKSKKNNAANFQLTPCIVSGGRATMTVCAMQMESKNVINKVLFFKCKAEDVKLYNAATRRTLNRRAFNVIKYVIQAAVDKHRLEYFKTAL